MKTLLLISLGLLLYGCATIPQGTAPAASPLTASDGTTKHYEVVGKAEGSAGNFALFGLIPFGRANIEAAVREAVSRYKGDNLINVHYYVSSAWYLVGSSSSLTVKGDVIRYTASGSGFSPGNTLGNAFLSGPSGMSHRLAVGNGPAGLSAGYTLTQSFADYLLFSFSLGYKRFSETETSTWTYQGSTYELETLVEYNALPVMLNLGVSGKSALNPFNPYVSAGIAYIPVYYSNTSLYKWNQVGFNINAGLDYEIIKGLALGVDYRYVKSLQDFESAQYYDPFVESLQLAPGLKAVNFSNLSLGLTFYP